MINEGSIPLPMRGRRVTPWLPREPCKHDWSAFVPIEDFLKKKIKLASPCAVQVCGNCGEVSGVMW